jgi:hypothetical protein
VLIATLTTVWLTNVEQNPAIPPEVKSAATVRLSAGVPFVSDADLHTVLEDAGVPPEVADDIVEENASARIDALRAALASLALLALVALLFTGRIPVTQQSQSVSPAASAASP